MKKIMLATLLASGLMAADSGFYVGADVGNTAADFKATAPSIGYSSSITDDGGSQTLKVGYYFDKNSRTSAFYQHLNVEDGSGSFYGIGYDYLIGDNAFKPFIGAIAGYGSVNVDSVDVAIKGSFFGAQAGLNYSITDNFSAEAGYRYMKANMDDTIVVSGRNLTFELDTIKNWFIGANYKF